MAKAWEDNDFLDQMRLEMDPQADAVIAEHFAGREDDIEAVHHLFGLVSGKAKPPPQEAPDVHDDLLKAEDLLNIRSDPYDSIPEGLPGKIQRFVMARQPLPTWADTKKLKSAEKIFKLYEPHYLIFLLCKALPETYACWRGAQLLALTGRLTDDEAEGLRRLKYRIVITAQFVLDVMTDGGLTARGDGIQAVRMIRLIHASIRYLVMKSGTWETEKWGEPINQEDMAMTLMAFSVQVIEGFECFNVYLRPEEKEAIFHTWRLAGHYLGIRSELLPETFSEGRALWKTIIKRQQTQPSDEDAEAGKMLTQAIIEYVDSVLKTSLDLPSLTIRRLLNNATVSNYLGIREVTKWRPRIRLFLIVLVARRLRRFLFALPWGESIARFVNSLVFELLLIKWNKGKHIYFYIPHTLTEDLTKKRDREQ